MKIVSLLRGLPGLLLSVLLVVPVRAGEVRRVAQAHAPGSSAAAMHGAAARPAGPAKLAEVILAPGVKDKAIERFLRDFAEALKSRDAKPLLSRLAPSYTIEGLPPEWEIRDSFIRAMGMVPGPEEILVNAITQEGAVKVVRTEMRFAARTVARTFRFDAEDRLLGTDFLSMKRMTPVPKSAPNSPAASAAK